MMELLHPWVLLLLPVPLLMRLARPGRQRDGLVIPERLVEWLRALQGTTHWHTGLGRAGGIAAIVGWIALVLALATPLSGRHPLPDATGRDLMITLDLSVSMLTRDVTLDDRPIARIEAVKQLAGSFIRRRDGDRIGLIGFADQPFLIAPPTYDVAEIGAYLEELDVGLPGRKTAVGDAIGMGVLQLRKQPASSRVLLLLTDGSSNSGSMAPAEAAAFAREHGIRIHTIGFAGEDDASPDQSAALASLAEATGGRHFAARSTAALRDVYLELDRIEAVTSNEVPRYAQRDFSREFTLLAVIMLGVALSFRRLSRRAVAGRPG